MIPLRLHSVANCGLSDPSREGLILLFTMEHAICQPDTLSRTRIMASLSVHSTRLHHRHQVLFSMVRSPPHLSHSVTQLMLLLSFSMQSGGEADLLCLLSISRPSLPSFFFLLHQSVPPLLMITAYHSQIHTMAKELASMSLSHRGAFDTRRALRDTRARPWLTNSVLRGPSTTVGAVKASEDAPLLSKTTSTVQVVADPAPLVTVNRVSEKLSASKIPVLSRRCQSISLDKGGVRGKDIQTAKPCTVTGMATSASRIPVRSNVSSSGRRPAPLQQVRPSKPVVAYAGLPKDKKVGKDVGTGDRTRTGAIPAYGRHFEEMSIRKCLNPEPIRTHRSDIRVRSILKHRAEPSGETDPRRSRFRWPRRETRPNVEENRDVA